MKEPLPPGPVQGDYSTGDVRVYPESFAHHGPEHWGDREEYSVTGAQIRVYGGMAPADNISIVAYRPGITDAHNTDLSEKLAMITMSAKDAEHLMETLVYSFAGMDGLKALKHCMGQEATEPPRIFRISEAGSN